MSRKGLYRWSYSGPLKSMVMSRRIFSVVAIGLIASVLFNSVAHACSDLTFMRAVIPTPCDHHSSDQSPNKAQTENCDAIRYGMLSTKASFPQMELLNNIKLIASDDVVGVSLSRDASLPTFRRSQGPPFSGLGLSPRLSCLVLRI